MTKNEMVAMRKALGTIGTKDKDTITMANVLQFLDQKIGDAERAEKIAQQMKAAAEKAPKDEEPKNKA